MTVSYGKAVRFFLRALLLAGFIGVSPDRIVPWLAQRGDFAFLVHPRDLRDASRQFPFIRLLPRSLVDWLARHLWPFVLARIVGVRSVETGRELVGYVVVCPLFAEHMFANPHLARIRILQAAKLAEKLGCSLIGLGALIPGFTERGRFLQGKVRLGITTGYAYTTAAILELIQRVARDIGLDLASSSIAIVGAAGAIGSLCARSLAGWNLGTLLLVDQVSQWSVLEQLGRDLRASYPVKTATDLSVLREADVLVIVTSSASTLIKSAHLKPGAIVIDDTQPRNTNPSLIRERPDVLILDVVAHVPGVTTTWTSDLLCPHDMFTCQAELVLLTAHEWTQDYGVGTSDPRRVSEVSEWARAFGITAAEYQSFNCRVTPDQLARIRSLRDTLAKPVARNRNCF